MRIHRLRLRSVKGVEDREIAFPDRGVIVLEGPNEVGKTTLLEALDILLEEKDSSRKRHVLALRPVGRDVPTAIEAELSSGPYRFRYRKQWFRQPATELHVSEPRVEQLTGAAAHERVVAIIAETTDVALWRALRLMQAAPLGQVELTGSRALSAALDGAARSLLPPQTPDEECPDMGPLAAPAGAGAFGAGVASAAGHPNDESAESPEALVAAVEAELARYYTAGRGQPTGEFRDALATVDAAVAAERVAAAAVAEVVADVGRHEEVAEEARRAARTLEAARAEEAAQVAHWDRITALEEDRRGARREAETADREAVRAQERHAERQTLIADIAHREDAVREHERAVADLLAMLDPDEAELADLVRARGAAEERWAALGARVRRAELAVEVQQTAAEVDALAGRLARAEAADGERREAAAELARADIDEDAVRRAERAAAALDLARSDRVADSARVRLVALADDQSVIVDGTEIVLADGEDCERRLLSELEIVVPGRVALRWHPESGAAARAARVAAAERELAEALTAAGVADVGAAHERLDRRRTLADRLARATDRLDDIVATGTLERLRDELAVARARHAAAVGAAGASAAVPTRGVATASDAAAAGVDDAASDAPPSRDDATELERGDDLSELRERLATTAEDMTVRAARADALAAAVTETRMAHARADSLLGAARRELDAARDRLERQRETDADDALARRLTQTQDVRAAARHRLATAEAALGGVDLEQSRVHREAAMAAVRSASDRVAALRDQLLTIEARLEQSGRQGRYDALESARGTLEHAERKLASVRRRAEAARLLYDTLQTHRAAAKRRYVAPFAAAIQRLGKVVYGPGLEVEVDEALTIEARVLDGERIAYEALSTGAKEQLAILTRLAVATLVDAQHGVPVVIDDALGYSDPARLRRMTAAFSLVGTEAQVILLTCTPGRYDGIVGAHVIRLGDDVRSGNGAWVGDDVRVGGDRRVGGDAEAGDATRAGVGPAAAPRPIRAAG